MALHEQFSLVTVMDKCEYLIFSCLRHNIKDHLFVYCANMDAKHLHSINSTVILAVLIKTILLYTLFTILFIAHCKQTSSEAFINVHFYVHLCNRKSSYGYFWLNPKSTKVSKDQTKNQSLVG